MDNLARIYEAEEQEIHFNEQENKIMRDAAKKKADFAKIGLRKAEKDLDDYMDNRSGTDAAKDNNFEG